MQIGLKTVDEIIADEKKQYRKKILWLLLAIAVIIAGSLVLRTVKVGVMPPENVLSSYRLWFRLKIDRLLNNPEYLYQNRLIERQPDYYDAISRVKITALTFGCGALLAISGHLFQTIFRNPIAAPTMLGVNTGVELGILVLVMRFGADALYMPLEKYIYCYIGAAAMLGIILIFGKISSGKNKFSVFDLLIVGAILSQVAGAVKTYFTFNMDNDYVLLIQEISNAIRVNIDDISLIFLGITLAVCLIPVYLTRFSFNAAAFDADESKSYGVNTIVMKVILLIVGTFMVTAAMVHCGTVGMAALIAPFISRAVFGADSRKLFWSNILIGGGLLVLCRDIASMIKFTSYGIPMGIIVDFIAVPVFVLILAGQRRTWE